MRTHLVLLALAALLPALLAGAGALWIAVQAHRATFEERLQDTTRALAGTADTRIVVRLSTITALASASQLDPGGDLAEFHARARHVAEALRTWITLTDAEGRVVVDTRHPFGHPYGTTSGAATPPELPRAAARTAAEVFATGRPMVGDLVLDPSGSDQPSVPVSAPVVRDGRVLWSITAAMRTDVLSETLGTLPMEEGAFAAVVDGNGRVVARAPAHADVVGREAPAWYRAATGGHAALLLRGQALDGQDAIHAFARLQNAPGWTVVVAEPYGAYAEAWQGPLRRLALWSLLPLALTASTVVLLARRLVRPLGALTAQAQAVIAFGAEAEARRPAAVPPSGVHELEVLRHALARADATLLRQVEAEREAAEALREGEDRLRELLATLDLGAFIMRTPSGVIRHWSAGCETLYGWTAGEAVGRVSHELLRTAFPVPLPEIEAALAREGAWAGELRHRRRDGAEVVVAARIALRQGVEAGAGLVLEALADVSALKQAEAALAAGERRYRTLFESAPLAFATIDPETLRFTGVNAEACAALGYAREELIGLPLSIVEAGMAESALRAQARDALTGSERLEFETRHRRRSGELRDVLVRAERPLLDGRRVIQCAWVDITERKRSEAALAEGEARLRSVVESAADAILVAGEDGGILSANQAALRMFGYDRAEGLLGQDLSVLMPAAQARRHPAHLAAHRRGADGGAPARAIGVPGRELMARRRDGTEFPAEISVGSFSSGGRRFFTGMIRDATARKRSEAALREAEGFLRSVLDASTDCVKVIGRDGTLEFMNTNGQCLMEIEDFGALQGRDWPSLWPEGTREQVRAAVTAALAGRPSRFEGFCPTAKGDPRWWDVAVAPIRDPEGEVERLVSVSRDITDRKRAEAELVEKEARFQLLVDAIADHAILTLDAEGRVASWTAAAERLKGWTAAEILGRPYEVFFTEADRAAGRPGIVLEEARREGTWRGQGERARRDGSTFFAEVTLGALRDEDGRLRGFAKITRDVTERHRAEERQALLAREVDHRAKNALAVVLSLLRLSPRDDAARFAAAVEGRVAAMARAHSLLATGGWSGAELKALAEGELAAHAGRVDVSGPPVQLLPEAVQPVAMLLHELATNAAKYGGLSAQGGRVALRWEFAAATGALRLHWQECGGPRLNGAPGRRGFGSRLIASLSGQQLGGSAGFEWAEDGLRCTITLAPRFARHSAPVPKPVPAAANPAPGPSPAMQPGSPRVLVVEDEALLAMELERTLGEMGCSVVGPARTLGEAVRLAAGTAHLRAAVLDVNLGEGQMSFPAMDLLETRGVPYVIATGYGSAGSLQGRERGAVAVLRKPYAREELVAALGRALAARREAGP